jgi:hypothetical protein
MLENIFIANRLFPRLGIRMGILFILGSLVIYVIRYDLESYFRIDAKTTFTISIALFLYGTALLLFLYLGGQKLQSNKSEYLQDELNHLRDELSSSYISQTDSEDLKKDIKEFQLMLANFTSKTDILSEEEKVELIQALKNSLTNDAALAILQEIENKYSSDMKTNIQLQQIREQLNRTRSRLQIEIEALGRRGNVNLVIGVITTGIAIYVLSSTVLSQEIKLTTETLVSHFTPRFALSLFIEIFSFFFLKLYKSGLSEIKYFQNELTNVELKFVALENSIHIAEKEPLTQVLLNLSNTERNFVLEKGQSTVEIEKSKIASDDNKTIINTLADFAKSIKS